jgi:hypothetical protein
MDGVRAPDDSFFTLGLAVYKRSGDDTDCKDMGFSTAETPE